MTGIAWYNLLADVIAPSLLGIGAIAVGFASWRVAKESTAIARRLEGEQTRLARSANRIAIAQEVFDWVSIRWVADIPTTVKQKSDASRSRSRVSSILFESSEPNAKNLQERLWLIDSEPGSSPQHPVAWSYTAGYMSGLIDNIMASWLKDPSAALPSPEKLKLGIREHADRAKKYADEADKKLAKKIRAARAKGIEPPTGGKKPKP